MSNNVIKKVGKKNLFRNDALEVMRVPFNNELNNISDEELVALAQQDIDLFRCACLWRCQNCGHEIGYKQSLIIPKEKYIHELKCCNIFKKSGCKSSMILVHPNNLELSSHYFDELYARYQDRIIAESAKFGSGEDSYDVYAALSGFFPKIVGKFARDKRFHKKSDNWFSSYFWISIKNKSTDIRKAKKYIKRSPTVRCEVCKKNVGSINVKHLLSQGHKVIQRKFYEKMGLFIMKNSGELFNCSDRKSLAKKALFLGKKHFNSMEEQSKKTIINNEYVGIYLEIFPESIIKNYVLSMNELVSNDSEKDVEYGDLCAEKCRVGYSSNNELELMDMSKNIVSTIIAPNLFRFRKFFHNDLSSQRKLEIIKDIVFNKSSYDNIDDKELDEDYKNEVKQGLSEALFDFIAKSYAVK